jgi:signal transduction histidine kinase
VPAPEEADSGAPNTDAPDLVGEYLELALVTARENLAEARSLISALVPAGLDDAGLVGAVARATSATGKATGIAATCAAEGDRFPLPTATEVVLLRVCQEALANVRKHAAATRVDVRLRLTAQSLCPVCRACRVGARSLNVDPLR